MNKSWGLLSQVLRHAHLERSYTSPVVLGRKLSYKSDISLDKIYPNSRQQIYTPPPPPSTGDKFSGFIPMNKIDVTYSRSTGPGGQNVNTVNTKVDLRFKLADADWIPEKTRQKMLTGLENKLSKEGFFIIRSDLTRSQHMNLADALEKLRTVIREFEVEATPPSQETLEKVRRRQERAARERLMVKRQRAQIKADRQGPSSYDA